VLAVASTWAETAVAAGGEGRAEAGVMAAPEEPRNDGESVRLDLGLGLSGVTIVGATNGAAGTLGGGLFPAAHAGLEVHLAGPAWLAIRARGSYSAFGDGSQVSRAWSAGGTIGPRFETPVFDFLDVGGHVFVDASYSGSEVLIEGPQASTASVGGVAGASLHFRASRFFGVRLVLDVVRAGYAWTPGQIPEAAHTYAQLTASPQIELTFTF
jgi:hypothetical protein